MTFFKNDFYEKLFEINLNDKFLISMVRPFCKRYKTNFLNNF